MAHFTQLNLQANAGGKPAPIQPTGPAGKMPVSGKPAKKRHGTAKTIAISGSLVAAALVATLTLGTNGCSNTSKSAIAVPSSPISPIPQTTPAPASIPSSVAAATTAPKPAKKVSRQRSFATYTNADYGISFRYPKTYKLAKADKSDMAADLKEEEMNFAQPGGVAVAAVQLPKGIYPGTNFASASFAIAVNSRLTADQCQQFAFEDAQRPANVSENEDDQASVQQPAKVKLGAAEYTEVESTGAESTRQADTRYYHVYQNGACYEFALGFQTTGGKGDVKPVDDHAVFNKLNWMLSTVKITAAGIPAKTVPALAETPATPPAVTTVPAVTAPSSTVTAPPAPTTASVAPEGGKN